jgi:hypothetical protein
MPRVLAASATADFRRLLFRLVVLLVKIWLPKALERRILPLPVALKRLAAPLLVFILGITSSPYTFISNPLMIGITINELRKSNTETEYI